MKLLISSLTEFGQKILINDVKKCPEFRVSLIKVIFVMILFSWSFFVTKALAAPRSTTFDDREICEKNLGVWRQFGNGCANQCESIFDQYSVCTNSLVFACDCGKNRCWNEGKCVEKSDFKKIFDQKKAEEDKKLEEAKKERAEKYKLVQQEILAKLTAPAQDDESENSTENSQGQNRPRNGVSNFVNNLPNQGVIAQQTNILANSPDNNSSNISSSNNAASSDQKSSSEQKSANEKISTENVPPLFLKKQQQNNDNTTTQNSSSSNSNSTNKESSSKNTSESKKSDLPEGLPVIPLPK